MAENSSYTLAEGDNYGGVIAGQINFAQGGSWDENFQIVINLCSRSLTRARKDHRLVEPCGFLAKAG